MDTHMAEKPARRARSKGRRGKTVSFADGTDTSDTKRKRGELEEVQPAPDAAMQDVGEPSIKMENEMDTTETSADEPIKTRLFVCVDHPAALGPNYACTLVCERDEWHARKQLDYWLCDNRLPVHEEYPYSLRELEFGDFSVAVCCRNPDLEFVTPLDEWARPDLASRKLFVYKDVYIGCNVNGNLDGASGALVVAVDVQDATAIMSNVLQERGELSPGKYLIASEFAEVPRHDGAFGVYPMSIYTNLQ